MLVSQYEPGSILPCSSCCQSSGFPPRIELHAAEQAADFGAAQPAYTLNIYQLSALYGRGQVATRTVFP